MVQARRSRLRQRPARLPRPRRLDSTGHRGRSRSRRMSGPTAPVRDQGPRTLPAPLDGQGVSSR
jgi:hypothetical protein